MALFGRSVTLQIGNNNSVGRSFTDLRVSFRVNMSRTKEANKATLQVFNPAPESVALAQRDGAIFRLLAGYEVPRLIFRGNRVKDGIRLDRQGPDRILTIEAQDGGRKLHDTRLNISFATETTLSQVYEEVAAQLDIPTGTIRLNQEVRFPHGINLTGRATDVLARIGAMVDSDTFVRDGVLNIVPFDGDTGESAVRFSVASGNLIGTPTAKEGKIEIKGLLEPSVRPGRKFSVEAESYSGTYICTDCQFIGDSGYANDFYVIATGRPI